MLPCCRRCAPLLRPRGFESPTAAFEIPRVPNTHRNTMSTHDPDPSALRSWTDPYERIRAEAICFGRALMPDEQTKVRTIITLVLVVVWAIGVLGPAFGVSKSINTHVLLGMTAIVFLLIGHLWGLEVDKVLGAIDGVTLQVDQNSDDNDEE